MKNPNVKHSIELEQRVLCAWVAASDDFGHTIEQLLPDDFYNDRHTKIAEVIRELYRAKQPIDTMTIEHKLKACNRATCIEALTALTGQIGGLAMAPHEAAVNELKELSMHRRLTAVLAELYARAIEGQTSPAELAEECSTKIRDVLQSAPTAGNTEHVADVVTRVMEELVERAENPKPRTVQTGIVALDALLEAGGLGRGRLNILGGRPGGGKSALATQLAQHALDCGTRVLFCSLEMSSDEIVRRMMQYRARDRLLAFGDIKQAKQEWPQLVSIAEYIHSQQLCFDTRPRLSPTEIRATCLREMRDPFGLIIVDYLQLMKPSDRRDKRSEYEVVSAFSRELKELAREFNVPVLALSQLNRNTDEYTAPTLADLRSSGAIEQDADVVMFLHRVGKDPDGSRVHLNIAKQRSGQSHRTIKLEFLRDLMRFDNWDGTPDPEDKPTKNGTSPFGRRGAA